MIDLQGAIQLSPILAAVISVFLTGLGTGWWIHERRIRALEAGRSRQARSLYGDEQNPRQNGVLEDIDEVEMRVKDAKDTIEQIEMYLEEINGYREKYKDQ